MSEQRVILDYLLDMREALDDIGEFCAGMDRDDFHSDKKTRNAVLRSLEILGEAAGKIPAEIRSAHPELPWPEMIGLRTGSSTNISVWMSISSGKRSKLTCLPCQG